MKRIVSVLAMLLFAGTVNAQTASQTFVPATGVSGLSGSGTTITSTVPILLPDGTAAAPSFSFVNQTSTGIHYSTNELFLAVGGTSRIALNATQLRIPGTHLFGFSNGSVANALDVILARDAANTLALRNGVNAQQFNLYNSYTDAANYSGIAFGYTTNVGWIRPITAGTGAGVVTTLTFSGFSTIQGVGTLLNGSNDTYTLGGTSNLWSALYLSRSIQGSKTKTLTDGAAAASFVRIAVPTNGFAAGKVIYTATSTDGTNILVTQNECQFAAADTGGTVTAGAVTCLTPATAYRRANTLICTISAAVATTNVDLQATCTDNLAGTQTMSINYRLDMPQTNTVTPQ